ncbi:MAG: nucleoside hydrolase [Clostridia bacterium]|nr:nucleoside hydrolase [Clostridia bacterium]
MRIGLDIDNVISSFDNSLLEEYLKHDKELRNTGIINENSDSIRRGMFDWTDEEDNTFYQQNIERIATNLKLINDADKFISKLLEDGNEIYIISGRDNGDYKEPYEMTRNWLAKNNINYTKLILTNAYDKHAKTIECIKNNIDIMVEDNKGICIDLKENGIKVLMMNTRFNQNNLDIERVSSWNEIYSKISKLYPKKEVEKINVILDTDTYNEADDQFALSYLLKSQDRFNIEAITIAPYQHDNDLSIEEGQEKSYQEVLKICNWLNFDTHNKIFKGSTNYITNEYNEENDAVNKIIETALKNKKTYIIAIGAITNVALAILKEPKIIDKLEVVWLGGHSLLCTDNKEFNFRQDMQAVKTVFESKLNLTILPCKGVVSNLKTSIYEVEYHLKGKNQLCNYLCERFYDDGKHGIQTRRVIWDISAIAYLINKDWFETSKINCPNINDDTSYELDTNNHLITMVNYLDSDKIYEDLFRKLGK